MSTQGAVAMRVQDARAMLLVTQEKLAEVSGMSRTTIQTCENEDPIHLTTAYAVLAGLNKLRKERELEPLSFNEVEWNIRKRRK